VFVFAIIYVSSFFYFLKGFRSGEPERILVFFIAGMSMYTVALSTTMQTTSEDVVNVIKYFKEIAVGTSFLYLLFKYKDQIRFNWLDWLVTILFLYTAAYVFTPLGNFTFFERVTVFKSYGLFAPLYFIGRWMPQEKIAPKKIIYGVIGMLICASLVQCIETIFYTHLQTQTGFMAYYQKILDAYTSGSYGLTQTFETDLGNKRFASFFQDPLDFAITLVWGICLAIGWLLFVKDDQIDPKWKWLVLFILMAALYQTYSRASMLGGLIAILYILFLIRRSLFIKYSIIIFSLTGIYILFSENVKVKNYIIDTILFRESSALSHLLAWLSGIEAMGQQPFGLGLGSSGYYGFGDGLGIGGENQLIFMGVQTGIISLLLYLAIYICIWVFAAKHWRDQEGYTKVLFLGLLLFKAASLIPMLTSYFESFLFMSYFTWFLTGFLISKIEWQKESK